MSFFIMGSENFLYETLTIYPTFSEATNLQAIRHIGHYKGINTPLIKKPIH